MNNKSQKKSFLEYEANNWFIRNKSIIESYKPKKDKVVSLIQEYKLNPSSVLEIGCSGGYRLNAIHEIYPNSKVYGIDPSDKAKEYCLKKFNPVKFHKGTADDLSFLPDEKIDLIIVGFVFYVIDRNILFKVISEIDRVLKNGGKLIIIDFFSETPIKNKYEHIKDSEAFSFKQIYEDIFISSKLYYMIDKWTYNHSNKRLDATNDYFDKYCISLLKKDNIASYR